MATPEELEREKQLNDLLNQRIGLNEQLVSDQQDIANTILDQVKGLNFAKVEQSSLRSITRDLAKTAQDNLTITLKELGTKKLTNKLESDSERISKNIQKLKQLEVKELTDNKRLQKAIQESINFQVQDAEKQLAATTALAEQSEKVASNFGVDAFQGFSDLAQKIPGLRQFSNEFADAANQARVAAAGGATNIVAFGKGLGTALKSIGPLLILTSLVDAFSSIDSSSGEVAKNLGISYNEALALTEELARADVFSDSLFINSSNLLDAQVQLSQVLGTNVLLNREILKSQVELTKQAGYSVEAATTLGILALATGNTTEDITTNFLGQAQALNIQEGISLNNKQLLEGINKVSKGTLATFASQPKELAKAVFQAKALGLEIDQLEKVADGLLDIESSLAAEFEAEVISGRQLNLERARFAALNNDIAGVGREIAAQGITLEKFTGATRIEQEALAKAVGLSRDELGESLILQQGLAAAGVEDEAAAKKKFERLKATVGEAEAIKQLGDTELARQLASVSAQEKFAEVTKNIKDIFVSLAEPVLAVINPIVNILSPVLKGIAFVVDGLSNSLAGIPGILAGAIPVFIALKKNATLFAGKSVMGAIATIFKSFAAIPFGLGIPLALAAVGGLVTLVRSGMQVVQDGMAPSSRGPFTVTDSFGATAITARGDGLAVSPNITREDRNASGTVTLSDAQIQKIANAVRDGASRATINLDGDKVSSRLQTPTVLNTLPGV